MTTAELRKIAEAATPGEWVRDGISVLGAREEHDLNTGLARLATMMMPWERERMEADAEFIATFNPKKVLELLDQIEQLQAVVRDSHDECTYQTRIAAVEKIADAIEEHDAPFEAFPTAQWIRKAARGE